MLARKSRNPAHRLAGPVQVRRPEPEALLVDLGRVGGLASLAPTSIQRALAPKPTSSPAKKMADKTVTSWRWLCGR